MIEIAKLRCDTARNARAELDPATVSEYADAMRSGAKFPHVICYCDGQEFWLADGYHRVMAAQSVGLTEIYEDRHPGTRRDATLLSLSANSKHGLRRSNRDKRLAVETLLADPEWATWSSREIARICAVTHPFVEDVRRSYLETFPDSQPETRTFVDDSQRSYLETFPDSQPETRTVQRNGTTYTVDVSRIGKQPKPPRQAADGQMLPAPKPPKQKLLSEEESALILAENERLKEIAETIAADARETLDDNKAMAAVFDADDRLAAAAKEIDRLRAEVKQLQLSLNGKLNECSELNRLVKYWKRKAEQMEKAAKEGSVS